MNRGSVRRVNADAHPAGLMNIGGFTSSWISQLNRKDAEVVIDLGSLPYEVRGGMHQSLCSGGVGTLCKEKGVEMVEVL